MGISFSDLFLPRHRDRLMNHGHLLQCCVWLLCLPVRYWDMPVVVTAFSPHFGVVARLGFAEKSLVEACGQFVAPSVHGHLRRRRQLAANCSTQGGATPAAAQEDRTIERDDTSYGWTDDEFESWFASQLALHPLLSDYPQIADLAPKAVRAWRVRYRGNPALWQRVFKVDRVAKELVEAAPILDAVINVIGRDDNGENEGKYTIVDLASGKGYLSMFLSEILSPEKVDKIVLVDKAWPMCGSKPLPHHMSWAHIYGNSTTGYDGLSYFATWPIPLHTSKQDIKQNCNRRQLKKVLFDRAPGPVLILAVHLCGTLSLKAVEMFNEYPEKVNFLALKPCCLPPMLHAKRGDVFEIGQHSFDASEVCAVGRFKGDRWYGPPRWHLEHRFNVWAENLFRGVDLGGKPPQSIKDNGSMEWKFASFNSGRKAKFRAEVQFSGGFQNTFIFAERSPITSKVWDGISQTVTANQDEDNK